jgi:nucleotide-binding universal stress UspA family protein
VRRGYQAYAGRCNGFVIEVAPDDFDAGAGLARLAGMKLERIAVGVDFSAESEVAVRRAMTIARHAGAELVLVHVGPVPDKPTLLPEFLPPADNELRERLTEQLGEDRRQLEELRQRLHGQGVEVSNLIIDDRPHEGLDRAAEEVGADLIIVGTHGRTGIRRFALGSVAERVVRTAPCSVMVARQAGGEGFERILVPVDFSEITGKVVEAARAIAAPGAALTLLHGWHVGETLYGLKAPLADTPLASYAPVRDGLREHVMAEGRALAEAHHGQGLSVRFEAVESPPVFAIQEWLDNDQYDLVVMGSRGRRGLERLVLGSVAEKTVRHAPCSVLVVR